MIPILGKEEPKEQPRYKKIDLTTFFGLSPEQVKQTIFMVGSQTNIEKTIPLNYLGNDIYGNKLANSGFELNRLISLVLLGAVDITIPENLIA